MKRDVGITYLLWFFLGVFSAHRFYLGKTGTALLQMFTLGGLGVWLLIDVFLIPSMVREYNRNIDLEVTITYTSSQ